MSVFLYKSKFIDKLVFDKLFLDYASIVNKRHFGKYKFKFCECVNNKKTHNTAIILLFVEYSLQYNTFRTVFRVGLILLDTWFVFNQAGYFCSPYAHLYCI